MSFDILSTILFVLAIALVATSLFRLLKLPTILGYIIVGIIAGPQGVHIIPDIKNIHLLAEFGIVFLMFTVGLKFSLKQLWQLKVPVFVLGGLQVIVTVAITTFIGTFMPMFFSTAVIIGGIAAMSSTAIVVKLLTDQGELNLPHGLNALGILLFQDLAVVPFIILIASFSQTTSQPFIYILGWSLLKGFIALCLIFILGRYLLKPFFHLIANVRVVELFTLTVLLVTTAAAALTNALGLSYALGAFLAGMMLAETEFQHQIEVEIRPFRDVLLGIFFISIGMLLNITGWEKSWFWILLLFIALVFGKSLLIITLSLLFGNNGFTASRTGIVLAQGGEFGFAILTLALQRNLLPTVYGQNILGALLLSIITAPFLIQYNQKICKFLLHKALKQSIDHDRQQIATTSAQLKKPVIIFGYGRFGKNIGSLLEQEKINYLALDINPHRVRHARQHKQCVHYGDATHPEIIKSVDINNAAAVVICLDKMITTLKCLRHLRRINSDVAILVRCHDEHDFETLQKEGASVVIPEVLEGSLALAYNLLLLLDVPSDCIERDLQKFRNQHNELLQKFFQCS